jgi:AcrR family transcriptional regulator
MEVVMNRRERKKQQISNDIISNARILFQKEGYNGTTLEDIAVAADIGIGTIYNYYHSKADLFLSIVTDELKANLGKTRLKALDAKENIVDQTIELIINLAQPLQVTKKEMWKELIAVAIGQPNTDNRHLNSLIEYDSQFVIKLNEFFAELKNKGALSNVFPSETAATVIFYNILTSYLFYLYNPEKTMDELTESISEQVQFILEGWETAE